MGEIDWRTVAAVLVMLVGLGGTVLPLIPGIPLIFLAMLGYDWTVGFQVLGPSFLITMLILVILSWAADYFSGVIGAQRYGASSWGKIGVFIGGIVGFGFGGPLGIILGSMAGVIMAELLAGKNWSEAISCSWGAFIGILAGSAARLAIAAIMIIAFLIRII